MGEPPTSKTTHFHQDLGHAQPEKKNVTARPGPGCDNGGSDVSTEQCSWLTVHNKADGLYKD